MSISVTNLKVDYKVRPIAVDSANPRFFWQIESDKYNVTQKKYRIIVSSSKDLLKAGIGDMWDSGLVESDETVGVEYGGRQLSGRTDYYYSVYSDCGIAGKNKSLSGYFRTGLLGKDDFSAKWIRNSETEPFESEAHAGYLSKTVSSSDKHLKVTLDLGKKQSFDRLVYYGLRIFEFPGIADYPGYQFPLSYRIFAHNGKNDKFEKGTVIEDRSSEVVPNPGAVPVIIDFDKIKARYVTFEAVTLQAYDKKKYSFGLSQIEVHNGADIISEGCRVYGDEDCFKGEGFGPDKLTDGTPTWHKKCTAKPLPGPYMKKDFTSEKKITKAYVYMTALGLYEAYINGKKIGEHYLAPEWTDYGKYVQYTCEDVTKLIKKGKNTFFTMLGDGWYAGRIGMANVFGPKVLRGKYGKVPEFRMQLEIFYEDGTSQIVKTDETWLSAANTPVRSNDILDGEYYDARYEDNLDYKPVTVVKHEGLSVVSFINEQISVFEEIRPVSITEPVKGKYVVDFGKHVSGFCEITMQGSRNRKVILRHAGGLKKDGTGYFANLRGAFAIDSYVFKNSKKVKFRPHFTYHGFRYLEITGLQYKPSEEDIVCKAISSGFEETGKLSFENDFYDWLINACKLTVRSNLVGVVTDCNDRDERLPWLMEGIESQKYIFDGALFWERHNKEIHDEWQKSGKMITQAPDALNMGIEPGHIARTIINIIEYEYLIYGNSRITEQYYDFLKDLAEKNRKLYPDFVGGNGAYTDGDWLNTNKIMTETGLNKNIPQVSDEMFVSVYNARFYRAMAFAAKILGKNDDYSLYKGCFDRAMDEIEKRLVKKDGSLVNPSQAAYGLILYYKLTSPKIEHMLVSKFKELAEKSDLRFITGVYTVGTVIGALSDNGMHDYAYKMMSESRLPSFKYMKDSGASTIWERWDTQDKDAGDLFEKLRWQNQNNYHTIITENGYEDISMNSFNHIEYTCITPWITENVLGLRADYDTGRGMKHFNFKTVAIAENKWSKGLFKTIRGMIGIAWKCNDKVFECKINIPANTSCTFNVPDEYENITVNNVPEEKMKFELGSGSYYIKAEKLM